MLWGNKKDVTKIDSFPFSSIQPGENTFLKNFVYSFVGPYLGERFLFACSIFNLGSKEVQ